MQRQRQKLSVQCSYNPYQSFSKILIYIFSDEHIYHSQQFRKLLRQNPRGFVHVNDLLDLLIVSNYFEDHGVLDNNQKFSFIQNVVEAKCHDLHYNLGRVRRKIPFNMDIFKKIKPICIERFTKPVKIEEIHNIFGGQTKIFNHNYQKKKKNKSQMQDGVLIYANNYREKIQSIRSKKPPFIILSFEDHYRQYELSNRMKDKKFKSIFRPIETPRKRGNFMSEDDYGNIKMQSMQEEHYGKYKKNNRSHPRENPNRKFEQFISMAREPNPTLNNLLIDMMQNDSMNNEEMKDESTMN